MRIAICGILATAALAGCSNDRVGGDGEMAGARNESAAATAETTAPGETLVAIPELFRGRWNFAPEDCGSRASEGALAVTGDRLAYYESAATIAGVMRQSPTAIIVEADFTGEGETWRERLSYELNAAGDRLTTTTEDGDVSVRMRCP